MKTTELYIEQVIIGLLVLAIVAMPWAPELSYHLGDINLAEGSVLLGLAFLLGIPFDRFADTLSDRLDQHHRLQFALDRYEGKTFPEPKPAGKKLQSDIFAEDQFRLSGLREEDAVVNWIEYHRSRIRLARALAVYGAPLTLSLTLSMARKDHDLSHTEIGIWLIGVAVGYFAWGMLASSRKGGLFGEELPRTDDATFFCYAIDRRRVDEATRLVKKGDFAGRRLWSDEWISLVVPVFSLVVAFAYGFKYGGKSVWVALCGALVTVVSTWSWWRISGTYRAYLVDVACKKKEPTCPETESVAEDSNMHSLSAGGFQDRSGGVEPVPTSSTDSAI